MQFATLGRLVREYVQFWRPFSDFQPQFTGVPQEKPGQSLYFFVDAGPMGANRHKNRQIAFGVYTFSVFLVAIFGIDLRGNGLSAERAGTNQTTNVSLLASSSKTLVTALPPTTTTAVALPPSPSTTTPVTVAATASSKLSAAVVKYLATRQGTAEVAIYDRTTGLTWNSSGDPSVTFDTASIVKVTVLIELLANAQDHHRPLTATETAQAKAMVSISDNDATTSLWNELGQDQGLTAMLARIGTTNTKTADATEWGLTKTTAADQLKVLRTIFEPNQILTDANRTYAQALLSSVVTSQHWGVSAGTADPDDVLLKNGWLPESSGWYINSIGSVAMDNHDYLVAVLTKNDPSEAYGIATTEQLSRLAWQALSD